MAIPLVMTLLGEDRPGLVEAVASAVTKNGGNWLESRMCQLSGHFAGILRVDVPDSGKEKLLDALRELDAEGIQLVIHESAPAAPDCGSAPVTLDLVGNDRPGIVSQVSGVLVRHSVNVEELQTDCVSAPMSAEHLFVARAKLRIPRGCDMPALRRDLECITEELMVDFTLADR